MKKIINSFFILTLFFPYVFLHASTFYFDPQEKVVGIDRSFTVALNFDAIKPVNAISVSILIPEGFNPESINNGNSIINTWIEEPKFDPSKRTITFSGIIPGGFVGRGGRLISLALKATKNGSEVITLSNDDSKVLLNSPNGIYDEISIIPLHLTISSLKNNLDVALPDTVSPEEFSPSLFQDKLLHDNKWVVLFITQDKDSGINHYEIQETKSNSPTEKSWKKASSPHVLQDQILTSNIFIKAVDESGNETIEKIPATNPLSWYQSLRNWIIITLLIICLFYVRKYTSKKNVAL